MATDWEDDVEGGHPSSMSSSLGGFVFSCKLFEILKDILDTFYSHDGRTLSELSEFAETISRALAFSRRLDDFRASVPDTLRATLNTHNNTASKHSSLHLQQQVLHCRFLYTRVLSLRPLLLLSTKRQAPASLDDDVLRSCCALCIDAARDLIEAIYTNLDTLYRSSGWHSVYFTFASATVLLAAAKLPSTDMISTDLVWSKAISILEHYKDQIASASRAIQMLQALKRQSRSNQNRRHALLQTSGDMDPGSQLPTRQASPQFSQFNPYGAATIGDAWFGQQFLDFEWLDFDADAS